MLDVHRLEVDLWVFDRALEEEAHIDAVALHEGPFPVSFRSRASEELGDWIDAQQDRVLLGVEAAYRRRVRRHLESDAEQAVSCAQEYVNPNPLSEEAQTDLVRAPMAVGDRGAAHRACESYRTLLYREPDDEPADELERRTAQLRKLVPRNPLPHLGRGPGMEVPGERSSRVAPVGRTLARPRGDDRVPIDGGPGSGAPVAPEHVGSDLGLRPGRTVTRG